MRVGVDGHPVTLTDDEVVVTEQVVAVLDHVGRVVLTDLGGGGPHDTAEKAHALARAADRLARLLDGARRGRAALRWPVVRAAATCWARPYPAGRLLLPTRPADGRQVR